MQCLEGPCFLLYTLNMTVFIINMYNLRCRDFLLIFLRFSLWCLTLIHFNHAFTDFSGFSLILCLLPSLEFQDLGTGFVAWWVEQTPVTPASHLSH